MPGLQALLCPSGFRSFNEIPFFPWKPLFAHQKPCLSLLLTEVNAIRELGGRVETDMDLKIEKEQPLISG